MNPSQSFFALLKLILGTYCTACPLNYGKVVTLKGALDAFTEKYKRAGHDLRMENIC